MNGSWSLFSFPGIDLMRFAATASSSSRRRFLFPASGAMGTACGGVEVSERRSLHKIELVFGRQDK